MKTITRLLAVLPLITVVGCTRWDPPRALPAPGEGPITFAAVRVTPRTTGRMVVMRDVRVTPDSVIGRGEGAPDPSGLLRGTGQRVAVHRSEVLLFEPAVPDFRATAGAALSFVLVGLGLYALNAVGNSG
jgi:hypothetical protein